MIRIILSIAFITTLLQAEDHWVDACSTESQTFKARQTRTLDSFAGLAAITPEKLTRYGGLAAKDRPGTGFFRVEKMGDRWWMIDPDGGQFIFTGVCSVRASDPRAGSRFSSRSFTSRASIPVYPIRPARAGS